MKRDLIKEIKSDCNIYAECPDTGEAFSLARAIMFNIDEPIPEKVQKIIDRKKQDIIERKQELKRLRRQTKVKAEAAGRSVNVGKILEKIAPAMKGFTFDPRDCRALFEPIDYIIFNKLTKYEGLVDSIYFVDIKTGGAGLGKHQKMIKEAIEKGRVSWDQYRGYL